ncbi:MAG: T9SS type A sorting domain-containing protein [Bacteroidetes bacterium]|nr:T9SS type A sorting domain-containing protein [Bacteroidota bacterium]
MKVFLLNINTILLISVVLYSQDKTASISGEPSKTYLNRNYISSVFYNNGISDINEDFSYLSSGFVYPKGSGKSAVFISGFIWGGFVPGDSLFPRVGGSRYQSVLQPGKIISPGEAEDPNLPKNRIYRVRRDVYPGGPPADFSSEITDDEGTESEIRLQYETDWNVWPWYDGAPFEDVNGNRIFEPDVDIPGYPGADQTIWFVANDLDSSLYDYPMNVGIELQVTIWNYFQPGPLSHVFFKKFRMINKSADSFDSVYVGFWSDPDIGSSIDDFAGCDTTLNLGYAYNAEDFDDVYEFTPPAVGYMLTQGPVVPGIAGEDKNKNGIDDQLDYAYREGVRSQQGFINLPMTSFAYYVRGNFIEPPFSSWTLNWARSTYNIMRGRTGLTGEPFIDPLTGEETSYTLSGDPLTQQGWIDGLLSGPGDRRVLSSSGPFNLAVSDTQDVIYCEIAAGGVDRWNSIKTLRYYSSIIKSQIESSLGFIRLPRTPEITVSSRQNLSSIELWWDEDESAFNQTESFEYDGYSFQGYNVYQLYNDWPLISNSKRLVTFDKADGIKEIEGLIMDPETGYPIIGIQQFGSDSGIRRRFVVDWDSVNNIYLMPGRKYNFMVTAYSYNPDPGLKPKSIESLVGMVELAFQDTLNEPQYGDTLEIIHTAGIADPVITPVVVDPYKLTGHRYKIDFDTMTVSNDVQTVWNLTDLTIDSLLLENQQEYIADHTALVIDGIQLKINNEMLDVKRFSLTSNGDGPVTSTIGYDETEPPPHNGYSADFYRDARDGEGSIFELPGNQAAGGYYFCVAGGPSIIDHKSAVIRWTRNSARLDLVLGNKYEIRFTQRGGKAWMAFTTRTLVDIPFELWYLGNNIEDTSDDVRMMPWIFDDNDNDTLDFKLDHEASGGENDPYSDWIYFNMPNDNPQPGEQDYLDLIAAMTPNPVGWRGDVEVEHIARFVLMNYNQLQGSGGENEFPETGTTFLIEFPNPIQPRVDEFTFTSEILDTSKYFIPLPKEYLLYQNYPNPFNPTTTIRFDLVNHSNVKLYIYDILGQRVQTLLNHEVSEGKHSVEFSGRSFASGVYLYQLIVNESGTGRVFIDTKKMILIK